MAQRRGGTGILMIGILIGMILGVALAAVLLHYGWSLNPISYFKKAIISPFTEEKNAEIGNTDDHFVYDPYLVSAQKDHGPEVSDDSSQALTYEEFKQQFDGAAPDSMMQDEYSAYLSQRNEITVAKDELRYVKKLPIIGAQVKKDVLDSILLDEVGQKEKGGTAVIEYWSSPINYKGYKWANYKLLLFGYDEHIVSSIIFYEGDYYFKYGNAYYYLESSQSFRSMGRVEDKELTNTLGTL
jgi:hypothetical protein